MSSKEILRAEIKKLLKDVLPTELHSQGGGAANLLCSSPIWTCYDTIFLFLSMNSEIDTQPILEAALSEGKKVFTPRVEDKKLIFCRILSAEGPWLKGPFGIKEPTHDRRPAEARDFPALILTPGLAFDREGRRMGRGGGYYDRFLAELDTEKKQYHAVGICMDFQLIDEVPVGEYDKKVQNILTGKELYTIMGKR